MKKLLIVVLDSLFVILCNVFHCNYRHLDSVYQEVLPLSPVLVRETKMYKRLKRFVKIAIFFKKFNLILEVYQYTPKSVGRCVWNVIRDETKYILYSKDYTLVLGKWVNKGLKSKFIELAEIIDEEKLQDYEEEYFEEIKNFENIATFEDAMDYIKNIFPIPVSGMVLEEEDEKEIIANIIWLLNNAKNESVRLAIYQYALGDKVYLDFEEEREVLEGVFYGDVFCEYFDKTVVYARLKSFDGEDKTLRYPTKSIVYAVDAATQEELFFEKDLLV